MGIWVVLLALGLAGCTTVQNRRKPFVSYVGRDLTLVRPCVLREYVTSWGEPLDSYWENGRATELVLDDRLFTPAAQVVPGITPGYDWKLYPAADYFGRAYYLIEPGEGTFVDSDGRRGPYRIHDLPAGTKVVIRRVTTNNFCVCEHSAEGEVTLPATGRRVKFGHHLATESTSGTLNDVLLRAPWEDASVPARRYIGCNGKDYRGDEGSETKLLAREREILRRDIGHWRRSLRTAQTRRKKAAGTKTRCPTQECQARLAVEIEALDGRITEAEREIREREEQLGQR